MVEVTRGVTTIQSSLDPFVVTLPVIDIFGWFEVSNIEGVVTPPLIEDDNSGRISLAAVQDSGVLYVAAIYDSSSSGNSGSADLAVTCNASPCTFAQFVIQVEESQSSKSKSEDEVFVSNGEASLQWTADYEDGFVIGPINPGDEACFTHSNIDTDITQLFFVDGTNTDHLIASGQIQLEEKICVKFP